METMIDEGHVGMSVQNAFNIEERDELMDHIEKLTEENNDLLALNDKLSKRTNESINLLSQKTAEYKENMSVKNEMEDSLSATKQREMNIDYKRIN